MSAYLLDTCVLSELLKPKKNLGMLDWIASHPEDAYYVSVLSLGEIQKSASRLPTSKRKTRYQEWIDVELASRFRGRILGINEEIALLWGNIMGEAERNGVRLPPLDCLIAATAISHHLIVVTRNESDMRRCGAQVINPWT